MARAALVPWLTHWAKALAVYPVTTVTAIVITANHYFLDAPAVFRPDRLPRAGFTRADADRPPSRYSSLDGAHEPADEPQ